MHKQYRVFSQHPAGASGLAKADYLDEILFGVYQDHAALFEIAIRFYRLGSRVAAPFEVFGESWSALATMPELIRALCCVQVQSSSDTTVEHVTKALEAYGFRRSKAEEGASRYSTAPTHIYVIVGLGDAR